MAGEATAFVIDASADGGDEAADPVVYCFPEEEAEAEGATRQQRLRRTALLLLGLGDVFGQLTGHALGRASFAGRDCSAGVASLGHPSLALAVFFAAASGRCCCCSRPQRVAEHVAAVARLRAADPAAEIRAGRAGPLLGPVLRVVFARMASSARFPAAHVFPALLLPPPPTRAADADADAGADATALLSELCESRFDGLVVCVVALSFLLVAHSDFLLPSTFLGARGPSAAPYPTAHAVLRPASWTPPKSPQSSMRLRFSGFFHGRATHANGWAPSMSGFLQPEEAATAAAAATSLPMLQGLGTHLFSLAFASSCCAS